MRTVRASPRIPRTVIQGKRKPNPKRSVLHLAFIRQLCCIACGAAAPSQAAHVRSSGQGGTGIKPPDKFALPLCAHCHIHDQHRVGEHAFYARLGIDPVDTALRLWTVSGDLAAGERLVFRAHQMIHLKASTDARD